MADTGRAHIRRVCTRGRRETPHNVRSTGFVRTFPQVKGL